MDEYAEYTYIVRIDVPCEDGTPTVEVPGRDDIRRAIYQGTKIDTEDAISVEVP